MEFGLDWNGLEWEVVRSLRYGRVCFRLWGEGGLWVGQSVSEHRSVLLRLLFPSLRPTYYYLI